MSTSHVIFNSHPCLIKTMGGGGGKIIYLQTLLHPSLLYFFVFETLQCHNKEIFILNLGVDQGFTFFWSSLILSVANVVLVHLKPIENLVCSNSWLIWIIYFVPAYGAHLDYSSAKSLYMAGIYQGGYFLLIRVNFKL